MEAPTIAAETRDRIGTRYARRLRAAGRLPGVIYGHKQDPVSISLDEKEIVSHLRHGMRLFHVDVDGKKETCLVNDLQFGYLGDDIIHVDLTRVDLTEEVEVTVPIRFTGEAEGLKVPGAILRTVVDTITVRCRAMSIPSEIAHDISHLEAGGYVSAGEIALPEGSVLVTDPESVLCRISVVSEAALEAAEEMEEGEALVEGEAPAEGEGEGEAEGDASAEESDSTEPEG